MTGEQIRELPLNGRSYNDLALLNPGVIYNRMTGSSSSDGFGVRMSVNGARANNNLFLIDGTDYQRHLADRGNGECRQPGRGRDSGICRADA